MSPLGMTLLLLSTLAFFSWSAFRRWRQLKLGAPEPRIHWHDPQEMGLRALDALRYAFGQRKMPYYRLAGTAHIFIFSGFMVLLLRSIVLWGRGYDPDFALWGLLAPGTVLGDAYSFVKDVFVLLVLGGVSVFVYLRTVRRGADGVTGRPRMTLGFEGLLILGIIATMMIADVLYDGARIVREARQFGEPVRFHVVEFAGSALALALSGIESDRTLAVLEHLGFWTHSALVLVFLNILPFSKHFHIITAIPNVFLRDRNPAALPKVEDIEGRVEREEPLGIATVRDLTWKQILDLYTCTECGRCSDNCPAYTTGKALSPKHVTLALRDNLYASEEAVFGPQDDIVNPVAPAHRPIEPGSEPIHANPPAPDGYFRAEEPVKVVPFVISPEVVWACTTCRACEEQCPVMISYVDKIVGMRRELVMNEGEFPPEWQGAFTGMEVNANPWNLSQMDRLAWAEGLNVPVLADRPDAQVLYWVGCAASYDDRAKKTARAVVKLLKAAKVDFAVLGTEECCTGDPARRAGNEFLFQAMAEQNVETLERYQVAEKTVLTACPHCFNALKNEYPQFGGNYRVVHHTDYLLQLVREGKLRPTQPVQATVAYHDSCYLGRYNDVYEAPRKLLEGIEGVRLVEVPYWNRNKGLCCGAGGAQMFKEEEKGELRVNERRTDQLLSTGCDTVASACPFCMTMLTDGLKSREKEDEVAQLDVAEVLARACGLEADGSGRQDQAAE